VKRRARDGKLPWNSVLRSSSLVQQLAARAVSSLCLDARHHACRWSHLSSKASQLAPLLTTNHNPSVIFTARLQIGNRTNLISSTSPITARSSSPWPLFTVSTLNLTSSQRHFVHSSFNHSKTQLHCLTAYRSTCRQAFGYCPRHCLQPSLHPHRPRPSLWRYIPQIQGS
jgi:hypothetical protein